MRRVACLAMVTMIGVTLAAVSNEAQQARHRIRPLELTGNLHMLTSDPAEQGRRSGGNTAVFVTSDGVVLVDTKYQGYGSDILAEVRKISDKPVTTIINTHTHYDHSGSNPEFSDTVNFVTHENTAAHLASSDCDDGMGFEGGSIKNCERFQGENRKFLPDTTFSTRHTLFSGADQIDLYYFGRGHTDGDTFVVFKDARTVPHRRHVRPQGIAVHRRRQLERQRHRVRRNAAEGGRRNTGCRYRHPRPRRRSARLAGPRRLRRFLQRLADADATGEGGRPQRRRDRQQLHVA